MEETCIAMSSEEIECMVESGIAMSSEETECSSVVLGIEQCISVEAGGGSSGAMARRSEGRHSIYRVPEYIKNITTNPDSYRPQVVSLGPFHHGEPALLPMEKHKDRAVANFVHRSGKPRQQFLDAVEEIKEQLQDAYENLDIKWRKGTRFVELMLNDGCFLLEMARVFQLKGRVEDYEPDDPVFSEHGCLYLFGGIKSDVILMENQLPLVLLQKLMRIAYPHDFQVRTHAFFFMSIF